MDNAKDGTSKYGESTHSQDNTTILPLDCSSSCELLTNKERFNPQEPVLLYPAYNLPPCATYSDFDANRPPPADEIGSSTCCERRKCILSKDLVAEDRSHFVSSRGDFETDSTLLHQLHGRHVSTLNLNWSMKEPEITAHIKTEAGDKMKTNALDNNTNNEFGVVSPFSSEGFSQKNLIVTRTPIYLKSSEGNFNEYNELGKVCSSYTLQNELPLEEEQNSFSYLFAETIRDESNNSLTDHDDLQSKIEDCCERMKSDILLSKVSSNSSGFSSKSTGSKLRCTCLSSNQRRISTVNIREDTKEGFFVSKTCSLPNDCDDSRCMESETIATEKLFQVKIFFKIILWIRAPLWLGIT